MLVLKADVMMKWAWRLPNVPLVTLMWAFMERRFDAPIVPITAAFTGIVATAGHVDLVTIAARRRRGHRIIASYKPIRPRQANKVHDHSLHL